MATRLVFKRRPFAVGKEAEITMNRIQMVYTHTLDGCGGAGGEHNHFFRDAIGDTQPFQ